MFFKVINQQEAVMEAKRLEIATLVRAGHKTKDIINLLKVSKATVCRVRNRLSDGQDIKDRPRSGRPQKLSPAEAKKAFIANPNMKMSELAKKKKVCKKTVSNAVKAAGGKSLRLLERPLLAQHQQEVRLEHCQRLLRDLKSW